MLSGLYKKTTRQGSESAELKRLERAKKWDEQTAMFAKIEKEHTEERLLEVVACAGDMFRRFEQGILTKDSTENLLPENPPAEQLLTPRFISPHPSVAFTQVPTIYEVQSCRPGSSAQIGRP